MDRPARFLLPLLLVIPFVAFIAACGDDDGGKSDNSNGTPGTEAPVRGGEITIQHRAYASFDPHFTPNGGDISQLGMVFRGLYRLDVNDRIVPDLASELPQVSSDGKTYTLKLKPNLKWSDGAPLTAKDVVAGFQRTCNPDVAGQYSFALFNVVGCVDYYKSGAKSSAEKDALLKALGVRQVDDTTVELSLVQPDPTFSYQLALQVSWPSPSHIVKAPGDPWPKDPTTLAFSGPFKVESAKADQMVLVRNDNYGGEHLAYLDKITLRYIDDLEAANNAFRNDELSLTQANVTTLAAISADSNLSKELVPQGKTGNTMGLAVNVATAPLNNQKLRLALSQATDREALNRVLNGANDPTTSWIPESLIGISDDPFEKSIGFNLEAAKKNFLESGAPQGLKLELIIPDSPAFRTQAEFLKEQWKKNLGIDLAIRPLDGRSANQALFSGKYEVLIQGYSQDFPDPVTFVDGYFNTDGAFQCSNSTLDDLLAKAKVNNDAAKRTEQFREINRIISEEVCGMIPLYHQKNFYLVDSKLKGPAEHSTSQDRYLAGDWAVEEWYLTK